MLGRPAAQPSLEKRNSGTGRMIEESTNGSTRVVCRNAPITRISQNPIAPARIETIGSETSFETLMPRLSVAGAGCDTSD